MSMFVSTATAMTTQSLVKKEPLEEDVMSTAIYPTGMCMRRVFHSVLDVYHYQLAVCLYSSLFIRTMCTHTLF